MAYDSICRFLTSEYPLPFVKWLLNSGEINIQVLPTELSVEPIRSDALFQLPELNSILHLEFQTVPKSKPSLPVRMLDYWLRIYRKYECPIEQVVIFLKQTDSPAVYINELAVGNTNHKYRIIRLWEQDPQPLLTNPALLPLAVLAATNAPAALLEQVAVEIDKIEEREQQQNITACVEVLAALRFNKQLIRQYFKEELMEESPIYQEIIEKGAKKGKMQTLTRILSRRFGTISADLQQRLQALSIEQLDDLSDALFDFVEMSDLAAWLQNQQ